MFSPTIASDEKWDFVKGLELLTDNVALKKWLNSLEDEMDENTVVEKRKKGHALQGLVNPNPLLDKKVPEENFHVVYDDQMLQEMVDEQMTMVTMLKKFGKSKHLANRYR